MCRRDSGDRQTRSGRGNRVRERGGKWRIQWRVKQVVYVELRLVDSAASLRCVVNSSFPAITNMRPSHRMHYAQLSVRPSCLVNQERETQCKLVMRLAVSHEVTIQIEVERVKVTTSWRCCGRTSSLANSQLAASKQLKQLSGNKVINSVRS